ncbi:MAG: PAS domain-containing protein [Nitrospinales bacterium]
MLVKNGTVVFDNAFVPRWMYFLVGAVGLLGISILSYGYYNGVRTTSFYAPLINASTEIKFNATASHLWFEEMIMGDNNEKKSKATKHLDRAEWYAEAMLASCEDESLPLFSQDEETIPERLRDIRSKLKEFRSIYSRRIQNASQSFAGSDIDQTMDRVFDEIIVKTTAVERVLKKLMQKDLKNIQAIHISLIALCAGLCALVGSLFVRFDRQREGDIQNLFEANQKLGTEVQQRTLAERAMRKSQEDLSKAQEIARLGNWVFDVSRNEMRWSDELYRILGLQPKEIEPSQKALLEFVHPEDQDRVAKALWEGPGSKHPLKLDYRIVQPDGSIRFVVENREFVGLEQENPVKIVGTVQDISFQKKIELDLRQSGKKLRDLNHQLQYIREEEKTKIAREVHDELGQVLTVLKMEFLALQAEVEEKQPDMTHQLESMANSLDQTVKSVQRICTELRPQILHTLGLVDAISWQAMEYQKRTGISCNLVLEVDRLDVDGEQSTALFRIFQEALTNVARHSRAQEIEVALTCRRGQFSMAIRDNGIGFDLAKVQSKGSLGLVGIEERAFLLGGKVKISTAPGKGTALILTMPYDPSMKRKLAI